MAEMIKLFVNGEEVEVESGKNLIDAVGAVGIEIPHFCYHPALGADGNCRMCLVGIEDGRPPLVPACKTPAAEGMKVQLDTDKIKKIQRDMMEFELINHPIDCPVCDQAGECTLQDYYMTYDGVSSRMNVEQVKKAKKLDFGGGVVHDQERCVLCGRCVRFCRQITKTGELGIVNRTDSARVDIFPGRPLNNRYALNVVDLCPVGAMTSADFRFKQRVWFLKKDEGICHGCSKGCNIFIDHNREKYKDDTIYRFRPRHNDQVNGYFICDEGRLSHKKENEGRLLESLKNGKPYNLTESYVLAQKAITNAENVLILVSPNLPLEQLVATQVFAQKIGASLSGYSDGYIVKGDGDDFLIQDDKAANRKGLELLGINTGGDFFWDSLEKAECFICIDNELPAVDTKRLIKALRETKVIALSSHHFNLVDQAFVAIPVASFSEYGGSIINCDGVLQSFQAAVVKNTPIADVTEVLRRLGGPLSSAPEVLAAIHRVEGPLAKVDFNRIPAEGLKL
ncbi:MAG: 2Fe-2S iron-sulfur cluster-binding protein [Desulfocapsaceae bacterium]|nr:2Fe-2S iron-sulfur cluster-binding protein [Desulfocapsaceae bacterium]